MVVLLCISTLLQRKLASLYSFPQWAPPRHCPRGHLLQPGRMLVGSIACSCGRHLTWCCECGAVTYGPALGAVQSARWAGPCPLSRLRRVLSRLDEVHERSTLRPIDAAVIALHDPFMLLVSAGHQLGASASCRARWLRHIARDAERCDQHCGPDDPPNEFDDQSDDEQDD